MDGQKSAGFLAVGVAHFEGAGILIEWVWAPLIYRALLASNLPIFCCPDNGHKGNFTLRPLLARRPALVLSNTDQIGKINKVNII